MIEHQSQPNPGQRPTAPSCVWHRIGYVSHIRTNDSHLCNIIVLGWGAGAFCERWAAEAGWLEREPAVPRQEPRAVGRGRGGRRLAWACRGYAGQKSWCKITCVKYCVIFWFHDNWFIDHSFQDEIAQEDIEKMLSQYRRPSWSWLKLWTIHEESEEDRDEDVEVVHKT